MATQRQLAKAFSFSSPLSLITFMQLVSLLFTFLSLLSPAQSQPYSYIPLAGSQIYQQGQSSIPKPFIYETVAASSPAGSLLMHANSPHNKEALLLDDGQDHVSKEAPIATPAFIYESVAASFSLRPPAEGSELHDNALLQGAEAAILDDGGKHLPIATPAFIYESVAASFSLRPPAEGSKLHDNALLQDAKAAILDDGGKHLPSIDSPSFIYESVAAALPQKAHGTDGSTLLHDDLPLENASVLDEGIGKPIMKTEVAKPSYIYESVIAASIPSRPPSYGSILHNNVPQEENAFLLADDTINAIMQKKEDPIIAKPSFIYESVAASIHPEVRDTVRNNVPQEQNGFLPDDGGMHVDTVKQGAKPIKAGAQQEKNSLLHDDGKYVHKGSKEEEPLKAEPVAALSHLGSPRGSLLQDNVPQPNNILFDNGGKHVHESAAAAVASTQDGGEVMQDNVPQEKYVFLGDDGHQKPISSVHHDSNNRVLLIQTKPKEVKSHSLHNIDIKVNVQDMSAAKAPASLLHNNVPQGKHAFLVDDGGIRHVEHDSPVASSQEVEVLLHDNIAQEKHGSLVNNGGKHAQHKLFKSAKEEPEHILQDSASQGEYSSLLDDGSIKELHSKKLLKNKDDNINKKLPIYHKLRLGQGSFNEENLRIVVDDSSKNIQIHKGPQQATIADDGNSNEANPRMVDEDSSIKMIHEEHWPMIDTGIGDLEKGNIRLVIDDSSNNRTHEGAVVSKKEGSRPNEENLRMVVGNSISNMLEKGSETHNIKGNSNEESVRNVVVGDSSSKTVHGMEGNPPNEIHKGSEAEGYPVKDESIRMVVGVSSNRMIETGYEVQGSRSNENLRMVVGDSSKSMVEEGYGSPAKLKDNLRMVVDDITSNSIKNGPFHARGGRSRICTPNPVVCLQLAYAEHVNHIALYGLPPTSDTNPACCGILCVDLNTDKLNCGSCGTACLLLETCCNGSCTDLNIDSSNCGQCGNSCSSLSACQLGMCGDY